MFVHCSERVERDGKFSQFINSVRLKKVTLNLLLHTVSIVAFHHHHYAEHLDLNLRALIVPSFSKDVVCPSD